MTAPHAPQNENNQAMIEKNLEVISLKVIAIDDILFNTDKPKDAIPHAQSIKQRAQRIVKLLEQSGQM